MSIQSMAAIGWGLIVSPVGDTPKEVEDWIHRFCWGIPKGGGFISAGWNEPQYLVGYCQAQWDLKFSKFKKPVDEVAQGDFITWLNDKPDFAYDVSKLGWYVGLALS